MDRLVAATDFAARKHKDQRRKDAEQTPYINHPIGVAQILSKEGSVTDVDVLIGALLHDTVEDTECTFEEIEELFGSRVRNIVAEVTDDKNLEKMERKRLQVEVRLPTGRTISTLEEVASTHTGRSLFSNEKVPIKN